MMLECSENVQNRGREQQPTQGLVSVSQNVECLLVLADEIRPGEEAKPAYRIVLGGGHQPAGHGHGEQETIKENMSGTCQEHLHFRHMRGQLRRMIEEAPGQPQHRQHQNRHPKALVPREQRQLAHAQRQIILHPRQRELRDDECGDDPMKCLSDRAVAGGGALIWHLRPSECKLLSLASQRDPTCSKAPPWRFWPVPWSPAVQCGRVHLRRKLRLRLRPACNLSPRPARTGSIRPVQSFGCWCFEPARLPTSATTTS